MKLDICKQIVLRGGSAILKKPTAVILEISVASQKGREKLLYLVSISFVNFLRIMSEFSFFSL